MLAVTGSCASNHARTGLLFSQQARSLTRIEFSVPLCLCAELLLGETVGLGDGADGDRVVPHRASGGRLPRWLKLPGLRESLRSGSILPPIATKLEKGLGKAHEVARSIIAPRRENHVHELLFCPQQRKCATLREERCTYFPAPPPWCDPSPAEAMV